MSNLTCNDASREFFKGNHTVRGNLVNKYTPPPPTRCNLVTIAPRPPSATGPPVFHVPGALERVMNKREIVFNKRICKGFVLSRLPHLIQSSGYAGAACSLVVVRPHVHFRM